MRPAFLLGCSLLLLLLSASSASASSSRPNIIVVMADDMGWSDLGCFGGEIATPNLDRLAMDGLRFTQFYNTARCCPTRASLLTGVYPHQAGIGHMMEDRGTEGYRGELRADRPTIAEALRPAGYRTYMSGKWHVTKKVQPGTEDDKANWPRQRGFDRFYGTIHGAGSFYDPNSLVRDNTLISPFADKEYQPTTYYYTDAIADQASRFVQEHAEAHLDQPFFLYVAFTAPHWPLHALPEDVAKYRGRYDAGYEVIREARWNRQRKLGLRDGRWHLSPPAGKPWAEVQRKEFESRCMEVYAAMVDRMDQGVGRLMAAVEATGQKDNTLFLFLQDNGGCAEPMGRKGAMKPRASAPSLEPMAPESLQTQMIPKQTRDGFPMRQGHGILPGGADTYHAYGEGWASVSNTPFREFKHWVHEGGVSTPLVVHWPAGIAASQRGQLEPTPGHLIDLMPTCLEAAGVISGGPAVEGVSLVPLFTGKTVSRPQPIFFEHEGNRAVRNGRWKLVAKGPDGAWELYDMETDRTEMHNILDSHPEIARPMIQQWEDWATRTDVLPWPWKPAYKKSQP